jgi:uridine kinase
MGVIQQYEKFVKPAHEDFVKPVPHRLCMPVSSL